MNLVLRYVSEHGTRVRQRVARTMPGPFLVRLTVWVAAGIALAFAYPIELVMAPSGALSIAAAALLPALLPRTAMVTAIACGVVLGWLIDTGAYGAPVTMSRVLPMTAALYLMHSGAALAAVLPYDTVVSPGLLVRWLLRSSGVIAGTTVFGVLAFVGADLAGDRGYLAASIGGVVVVGVLTWVLVRKLG